MDGGRLTPIETKPSYNKIIRLMIKTKIKQSYFHSNDDLDPTGQSTIQPNTNY